MAIEAPLSRHKRNSFMIYIVVCVAVGLWFAYDGYLNQKFIAENTNEDGRPTSTLVFNRVAPPFCVAGAVLFGLWLYAIGGRNVLADENELVVAGKKKIPYEVIEKVDKTHFETKGFFTITYKNADGSEVQQKLSERDYDNLGPILDHIVAQIA